jgi:hypothetical protein
MFSNPWQGVTENGLASSAEYLKTIEMSEHNHPPFFSTWRNAYIFAIALFAIEVALLYAFTLRFS